MFAVLFLFLTVAHYKAKMYVAVPNDNGQSTNDLVDENM